VPGSEACLECCASDTLLAPRVTLLAKACLSLGSAELSPCLQDGGTTEELTLLDIGNGWIGRAEEDEVERERGYRGWRIASSFALNEGPELLESVGATLAGIGLAVRDAGLESGLDLRGPCVAIEVDAIGGGAGRTGLDACPAGRVCRFNEGGGGRGMPTPGGGSSRYFLMMGVRGAAKLHSTRFRLTCTLAEEARRS
jgi:hypothetical protein